MPKAKKVKNPCKVCLKTVSQKKGLQCQGACKSWVHFTCVNYTPGKIKDIKAGVIKISCPCPDCKFSLDQKILTDEKLSCSNFKCPANSPPRCDKTECPINAYGLDKASHTSFTNGSFPLLGKCSKEYNKQSQNIPKTCDSPRPASPTPCAQRSSSDSCPGTPKCLSGSSSSVPGDYGRSPTEELPSLTALEQMCSTVGQLTNQINNLMKKIRRVVQERNGDGGCGGGNRRCCSRKGSKSLCPKPCFCPGNPGKRI